MISAYLRFLGGEKPWQWAGGIGDVFWPMFVLGGAVASAALLMLGCAYWISLRTPPRGRAAVAAATAAYAIVLFGPALLAGSSQRPLVLMRLADALVLEPALQKSPS